MDLNEILVFAKVVQSGSFTAAARELGMPKSTVSRKVAELEERLGARLIQRTTRKLSLTDVGQAYYQHASRIVAEVEEAESAVTRLQEAPRGLLRITTPLNFGHLGPIVASFLTRYPEVQIEMVCSDRVVDLIDEGFDLAIRVGRLADSMLIARNLGMLRSVLVASAGYVATHGEPEAPKDLAHHECVVFGPAPDRTVWRLRADGKEVSVQVPVRFIVNDFEMLRQAALAGLGIAMLPVGRAADDLARGTLRRLLASYCSHAAPIHAVYPTTRHLSPKVCAFLDHLTEAMGTDAPGEVGETARFATMAE